MSTMLRLMLLAAVCGAGLGQDKCTCMPDKFQAIMTRLSQVVQLQYEFVQLAINHQTNQMVQILYERDVSVVPATITQIYRRVLDFNTNVNTQYTIYSNGTCVSKTKMTIPFQCIPSNNITLGETYQGFNVLPQGLTVDFYRFDIAGDNSMAVFGLHTQQLLMDKLICVPVVSSIAPDNDLANGNGFVFTNFEPCIRHDSWFQIPVGC
nr:ependymin domain-containing protein [Crepidula fornicata]